MQTLTAKDETAENLAGRINQVGADLIEIAKDLVASLDSNTHLCDELVEMGINRELVRRLEKLGRGQIAPQLMFATNPGALKLITLPLSEQLAALDEGIEVLDCDEETIRKFPVNELTNAQASQVIGSGEVRSIAQQRTWLRKKKSGDLTSATKDVEYRIHKNYVVTTKPGKWSRQLLLQWLTEMSQGM